ncbi:phosphoenolpyruvate--protein phosphotransferase [Parvularcula marina]|uniref:phosphoenolpyruvate--protein phosphotransferase n=1 Tax=Parvularcula marina TaxID=2292771 RepID=A0A371RGG2_9PROT|nr:phosphoenolpyruvate--protein phosphotransferase [Parvularcula marina]RFB04528.1 phosphoenolpyruvate--protein phosphotransferase [Parvularcula marina]
MSSDVTETGFGPRLRPAPRALLQRLRQIMAETGGTAQDRLDQFAKTIAASLVGDVCSIYVRRPDDVLELFASEGLKQSAIHVTRMGMDEGLVGWVARRKQPLQVKDAKSHEAFSYREETGEDDLNGFLGVPIIRSGQVLGVLVIQNRTERVYTDDELEVAQTVATILAEIVATGELLEARDTEDVAALLHKPETAKGSPIVAGIAHGIVFRRDPRIRAHPTFASDVALEKQKLEDAIAEVQKSVDDMIARDPNLSGSTREVLEVFRLFAYDKGWARKMTEKVLAGLSAESAVEQVQAENRKKMREVSDPYLRERFHDLEDLTRRLLRVLSGDTSTGPGELPENAVLLAESLGPAELLEYHSPQLKGVVVGEAAGTSHAAIIARSLGIPMVSGLPEIVDLAIAGDEVIIDGSTGEVHLRPPETTRVAFADKSRLRSEALAHYASLRHEPAVTKDGVRIELQMNAGLLIDMPHLEETGAKAVGLFRTELQFLLGQSLPTASAQETLYRQIMDAAGDKPVIFRTADIGSDKRAGYMTGPREANPAMGWRGLRMSLDREGLMRTQIRALISAARGRDLSFMFPLVTTREELITAKKMVDKELDRYRKLHGEPPKIRIGSMIEIPAAAWQLREIARECDFLSIGGNDLAQFFFAADRETDAVSRRYDPLSPSFVSFLGRTVKEAKAAGKPIGYCGEQAGDSLMALALLAIGVETLSVPASAIGPLKAMIRSVTFGELRDEMARLMSLDLPSLRPALGEWAASHEVEMPR